MRLSNSFSRQTFCTISLLALLPFCFALPVGPQTIPVRLPTRGIVSFTEIFNIIKTFFETITPWEAIEVFRVKSWDAPAETLETILNSALKGDEKAIDMLDAHFYFNPLPARDGTLARKIQLMYDTITGAKRSPFRSRPLRDIRVEQAHELMNKLNEMGPDKKAIAAGAVVLTGAIGVGQAAASETVANEIDYLGSPAHATPKEYPSAARLITVMPKNDLITSESGDILDAPHRSDDSSGLQLIYLSLRSTAAFTTDVETTVLNSDVAAAAA